jgi:hypothetical protein
MHDPASDSNSDEIEEVEVVPPPKRPKKPTRKIPLSRASQMGGSSHGASSCRGQRAAPPHEAGPQESVPLFDDYPPLQPYRSTSCTDRSILGSTSVRLE